METFDFTVLGEEVLTTVKTTVLLWSSWVKELSAEDGCWRGSLTELGSNWEKWTAVSVLRKVCPDRSACHGNRECVYMCVDVCPARLWMSSWLDSILQSVLLLSSVGNNWLSHSVYTKSNFTLTPSWFNMKMLAQKSLGVLPEFTVCSHHSNDSLFAAAGPPLDHLNLDLHFI